jgi:hypothetical protein
VLLNFFKGKKFLFSGVEHSYYDGGLKHLAEYMETPNTEKKYNHQTLGAKVKSQKGNSPDHQLRFLRN